MAQTNYTPISLYYSTTASAVPTAANLVPGELAINTNDGKLYYEDSAGVVQVLASKATSSGTFGAISATSITNSGLTSGRVVYTTTGGLETSSATLTYDGTTLTATTGANFGTTSGSVGIGTASPTKKLTVSTNTSTDGILITGSTNPRLQVIDTTNSVTLELISGDSQATIRTDTNHPLVFGTNGTERMTLDASGNLGLGVTPSAWSVGKVLQVGTTGAIMDDGSTVYLLHNAYYNAGWKYQSSSKNAQSYVQTDNGEHRWNTAPSGTAGNAITFTQAMTLDSSGNLLIGKTASGFTTTGMQLLVTGSGQFTTASGGPEAVATYRKTSTTTDQVITVYSDVTSTTAQKLYIQANGSVYNTTGTYGTISDIKLKENIVNATPKLFDLMQVKVRNYNLIGDTEKQIGVVAQELETVFPSMVEINSNNVKTVKYSVFVPMLIKALQEQQALIESLTTRLTALENK